MATVAHSFNKEGRETGARKDNLINLKTRTWWRARAKVRSAKQENDYQEIWLNQPKREPETKRLSRRWKRKKKVIKEN